MDQETMEIQLMQDADIIHDLAGQLNDCRALARQLTSGASDLCQELSDDLFEWAVDSWGHTNVEVVRRKRDTLNATLAAAREAGVVEEK